MRHKHESELLVENNITRRGLYNFYYNLVTLTNIIQDDDAYYRLQCYGFSWLHDTMCTLSQITLGYR